MISRLPQGTWSAISLCLAGAVLYFLSFLNFDLFALTWLCFVPVLLAVRDATVKRTLWLGTLFGAVTNAGGFYWIVHLLKEFGHLPLLVAILGFVLLCIYQGFLLAVAFALVRRAQQSLGLAPVWSLAIALPAVEFAYPLLFPSYIGNSQFRFTWITQVVDITGMTGLTILIALVNGAVFEMFESRLQKRGIERLRLVVPAAAFALCALYGFIRLPAVDASVQSAEWLDVGLIQTNIGARDKAANPEEFIARHREMSREAVVAHPEIDLIVWPEAAYNRALHRGQKSVAGEVADGIGRPVLFGAVTYREAADGPGYEMFNSLLVASANGEVTGIYDKIELLAFGETLPLSNVFPFLNKLGSWFTRGTSFSHLRLGKVSFLPTICYEDILPAMVRRIWRHDGPPDVLVNVTNDSWYGDTHQPMLHLAVASFRSIETRRALIRSTNTGISAIVDPAGRIAQRTGQWTQEVLVARVPLIKDGSTTFYMRLGNLCAWLCVALTLWGIFLSRGKVQSRPT